MSPLAIIRQLKATSGVLIVVVWLSASESLPRSSSSSRSEGGITISQTESGISPGFLETTRELPEEGTVHTQVAGIWVSSQASLPALELREPTMFSQERNSSGQEHSGLRFPQTQSQPPPSGHPSCEYSCPSSPLQFQNNPKLMCIPGWLVLTVQLRRSKGRFKSYFFNAKCFGWKYSLCRFSRY